MKIQSDAKEILVKARYSIIEIGSIRRMIDAVQNRLYNSMPAPRLDMEERVRNTEGDARDQMIDKKDRLLDVLRKTLEDHAEELAEAERLIESIGHAGTRSALRYYYLCGVRSWGEVAKLCHCDERTVRRWVGL